ncbi:Class 3 lipase [Brazilian cedratvirus IHUMI]|uniref:Class 3 lipase n=1 Tax=Brazilian cedratvirus IHUMI TaxID=2126980 RepID=A0A2R8FER2_9VIRU|nr:Class 3 lipase [Brazilian cedratvirus IHUMI]
MQFTVSPLLSSGFLQAYSNPEICTCPGIDCELSYNPSYPPREGKSFSTEMASYLLELVSNLYNAAYLSEPVRETPGLELVRYFSLDEEKQDKIAALYIRKKTAYLIFRGTVGEAEFALDLDYAQVPLSERVSGCPAFPIMVHRGFFTAYNLIARQISQTLRELHVSRIYIAGHSLGGALATLATFYQKHKYKTIAYVYGSPRVGNVNFSSSFTDTPFYNVQNENDIVCQVPLAVTPFVQEGDTAPSLYYYQHVGKMHSFRDNWLSYIGNHSINIYRKNLC